MNARHDHDTAPDLAEQAARRMTAPAGHEHGPEEQGHQHDHDGDDHHDHDDHDGHDHDHAFEWPEMLRIALVAVAATCVGWHVWESFADISVIGVIGFGGGGCPSYKEAFENLVARRMTMELSMSIAIIAAAAISEFFTALVIPLFVLIAEVLEGM